MWSQKIEQCYKEKKIRRKKILLHSLRRYLSQTNVNDLCLSFWDQSTYKRILSIHTDREESFFFLLLFPEKCIFFDINIKGLDKGLDCKM